MKGERTNRHRLKYLAGNGPGCRKRRGCPFPEVRGWGKCKGCSENIYARKAVPEDYARLVRLVSDGG